MHAAERLSSAPDQRLVPARPVMQHGAPSGHAPERRCIERLSLPRGGLHECPAHGGDGWRHRDAVPVEEVHPVELRHDMLCGPVARMVDAQDQVLTVAAKAEGGIRSLVEEFREFAIPPRDELAHYVRRKRRGRRLERAHAGC